MPLSSPDFYTVVNHLLSALNLSIQPMVTQSEDDGFFVHGLPVGPIGLILPKWEVVEHKNGFGGWLICGGGAIRIVRHRLAHAKTHELVGQILELKRYVQDVRLPEVKELIKRDMNPEGYYFETFDLQLAEKVVLEIMRSIPTGNSRNMETRMQIKFKSAMSKWLNAFPQINNSEDPTDDSSLLFLQDQVRIGYPEEDVPAGIDGFFRDIMVEWISNNGNYKNAWGKAGYTACVACTGKTIAGQWVTMIPSEIMRETPQGPMMVAPPVPLRIASQCAIGYNPKRIFREGNAFRRARKLHEPTPLKDCLMNGYEHLLGPHLRNKISQITVAFVGVKDVNLYDRLDDEISRQEEKHEDDEEFLDLDDMLRCANARGLHTDHRRVWKFNAEEWQKHAHEFYVDGKIKDGYVLKPNLTYKTTVMGQDVYTADMVVFGPVGKDKNIIAKYLVDGTLKAMGKQLRCEVQGRDRAGRIYPVDLIISGHCIEGKKVPTIPLSAVAGRAGIRYWDNFTQPIHPKRKVCEPGVSRSEWADEYDDLVKATYHALEDQGEDPDGLIDLYRRNPDPTNPGKWGEWELVGQGMVGYSRCSVLWENETSGSKARAKNSTPYSMPLNTLANRELELDDETRYNFNYMVALAEHCGNLAETADDNEEDFAFA